MLVYLLLLARVTGTTGCGLSSLCRYLSRTVLRSPHCITIHRKHVTGLTDRLGTYGGSKTECRVDFTLFRRCRTCGGSSTIDCLGHYVTLTRHVNSRTGGNGTVSLLTFRDSAVNSCIRSCDLLGGVSAAGLSTRKCHGCL